MGQARPRPQHQGGVRSRPMKAFGVVLTLLGALALAPEARAQQDYPNRTVRLIVPFAAGGGVDILARLTAQRLSILFGKPVVVENHTGATGLVAAQLVGVAGNDGYTLLVGTPS